MAVFTDQSRIYTLSLSVVNRHVQGFTHYLFAVRRLSAGDMLISTQPGQIECRLASKSDLSALVALEQQSFDEDQISRRQFLHLLTRANAAVLIAEQDGQLLGDVVVLFNRATSTARLYSIAVSKAARRMGVGQILVEAAETNAWDHGRAWIRLEVRKDNTASIKLFEGLGYRRFGQYLDYYEDHADAWRYEKTLAPDFVAQPVRVPYYRQSLEFTCGPAALIMAMQALDPTLVPSRKLELRLWREATTIFMTAGHGGCGPYGLALAAARRGFDVAVYVSETSIHLIDSVRSDEKKEVMTLVQEDMEEQLAELKVPIHEQAPDVDELREHFNAGAIPIALISSWQIYESRVPHWVVISGFDDHFVYLNDPYVDVELGETEIDSINIPISIDTFHHIARYGRRGLRAIVLIKQAPGQ